MTMPNFLVIGAAKSGTTSLYYYLNQHPQIYMSRNKEPHFFVFEGGKPSFHGPRDSTTIHDMLIPDLESYRALFQEVTNEKAIGEASPLYLYYPEAIKRIKRYIPDVRLIVILRNPVERAFSSYTQMVRDSREPCDSFEQSLQEERMRIASGWWPIWHYKAVGYYYAQLKPYIDAFGHDQMRIYLNEDLKNQPIEMLQDIFRFLEIEDSFEPNVTTRYNVSGVYRSKMMQVFHDYLYGPSTLKSIIRPLYKPFISKRLRERLRIGLVTQIRSRYLIKQEMQQEIYQQLVDEYREDILKLGDLIQRDLSNWLEY